MIVTPEARECKCAKVTSAIHRGAMPVIEADRLMAWSSMETG